MAATATEQVLNNGVRNLNLKYTIAGTTGDVTGSTLVDVSSLDTGIGVNGLTLYEVESSLTGFSAKLQWDATSAVDLVELPSDEYLKQDFSAEGGIKNNAGAGATGDVLITTTGYTASGDGGFILLRFKKT